MNFYLICGLIFTLGKSVGKVMEGWIQTLII
jgi:hypothetical protein